MASIPNKEKQLQSSATIALVKGHGPNAIRVVVGICVMVGKATGSKLESHNSAEESKYGFYYAAFRAAVAATAFWPAEYEDDMEKDGWLVETPN